MRKINSKVKKINVKYFCNIVNRDKIIALEDTEKYNKNIEEIKETVIKIKKAIEESVK
jgi:hypothetical protein